MPEPPVRQPLASGQPEPLLWALALAASIASFQTASAATSGAVGASLLALGFVLVLGLLAGLYRPLGAQGLGALGVPLALATLGCGWGPIAVALGAGLSQFAFDLQRDKVSARRGFGAAARGLLGASGAFWATALAMQAVEGRRWAPLLAGATAWLAITAAVDAWLAVRDLRSARQHVPQWVLDSAAWGLGIALHFDATAGLGLAVAAIWAEAGRRALAAERGESRVAGLLASAEIDPTTGLTETGTWRRALDRQYGTSRAEGSTLSVAIFDLDALRDTNAEMGFAAGDERLRDLARRLPAGPASGRWFGGAAIWALSEPSGEEALRTAEALRASFDGDSRGSLSCGLASTSELATHDAEDLVALAERALAIAKQSGRGRALLDLGGGRYRDDAGSLVEIAAETATETTAAAPPFFA